MAVHTYRNGKWYDKATGEQVEVVSKAHTWTPGAKLLIVPDIGGYDCPVTGKWIGSRAAHRENLKRRGCRLLEPGEKRESIKDRERIREQAIDRAAREAVMHVARNIEL